MANERIIAGKNCRMFFKHQLWVSENGDFVGKDDGDGIVSVPIKTDKFGNQHVVVKDRKGNIEFLHVDEMVKLCFHGRRKYDGKPYYLAHKDNNKANCSIDNLEWRIKPYKYNEAEKFSRKLCKGATVVVHRDGRVQQKGKFLSVYDTIFDGDIDMTCIIAPYVPVDVPGRIRDKRCSIDKLMDESGYVHGDKYSFNRPVILHRDNDWMNFHTDNLEFVEEDDPRYIEYRKVMSAAINERIKEENKNVKPEHLKMILHKID